MYKTLSKLLLLGCFCQWATSANATDEINIEALSWQLFSVQGDAKRKPIEQLVATGDKQLIPTFVLAMRWTGSNIYVAQGLTKLAGEDITHWHEAYDFQELNPQIEPHRSYRAIKMKLLGNTDQRFLDFFDDTSESPELMKIRLEEITWGGVLVDGIKSLDNPKMIAATDADYLVDTDLVFGIDIKGDVRAYPLRIMGWHEMLNDRVGGVPVALAYCTLCGSGILFETKLSSRETSFTFGSSGLLYRSNKLMFDRETNSLWNQFTGEPVVGALASSGIKLKNRPMTITSWKDWKQRHPDTKVLSLETGYHRNYGSGVTYNDYFTSPNLMFPAVVGDESLVRRKDYIFGIRDIGAAKAWPLEVFRDIRVLNDQVGETHVVLIGDAKTRSVRAYQRLENESFSYDGNLLESNQGKKWALEETFLVSDDLAEKRARIPGHVAYWFAWDNYLGIQSELYKTK